jgi:hypothetical protein
MQQYSYSTSGVSYLYCGGTFTNGNGLMHLQDGQHPTVEGYQALGGCLQPVIASYVSGSGSRGVLGHFLQLLI